MEKIRETLSYVLRAVVEGPAGIIHVNLEQLIVPLLELSSARRRLSTHRKLQLAERGRIGQVKLGARVVREYPREHRELGKIIISATSERVDVHQVLEVTDPSLLPLLCQSACARCATEDGACETCRQASRRIAGGHRFADTITQ